MVCRVCAKNKVAIIATGDANLTSKGIIPRPLGGMYLKHAANVIVNIKENSKAYIPSFKATLMKHQYQRTPKVVLLSVKKTGGIPFLDWTCYEEEEKEVLRGMGRITPSFRQLYEEIIADMRSDLQAALVDLGHKNAFDLLLKEAWNPEQAAI
jgi:hypothetical protein